MSDLLRQQLIEMTQAADAYHAEIVTELRAEIKRLRTNINEMQTYAERKSAEYEEKAVRDILRENHYRSMADAYDDMARRAIIAYGKVAE